MESRARGLGFQGWGISRGEVGQPGWAVRLGGMGRGPWGAGGVFFCFVFTFYFSNFALVFYLYAHLFLFYKIHTKAPKLVGLVLPLPQKVSCLIKKV